jgi:hypothetical protein
MTFPRALLATISAFALVPATASAATVTVTGDDGNPLGINPTSPTAIRNTSPEYNVVFGASDGAYHKTSVIGPDGADASFGGPTSCYSKSAISSQRRPIAYRGNGSYAVIVQTFSNNACTAGAKETRFLFSINGATAVVAPAKKYLLTRQKNSYRSIVHRFGLGVNPGTSAYDFQYLRNGVIGPDGGFTGPAEVTGTSASAPYLDLTFQRPGRYVAVARGVTNRYFTPFSAPVSFTVKAPFDLSYVLFPDSSGPSYKLQGTLRDEFARGNRVTVYAARGRKGGRYHRLGRSSKINSRRRFTLRFRLAHTGKYRMQYRFKGSKLVTKGKITDVVTIRRYRF